MGEASIEKRFLVLLPGGLGPAGSRPALFGGALVQVLQGLVKDVDGGFVSGFLSS